MNNTADPSQLQTLYIRALIFQITGLCVGLPPLVWAVQSLCQLRVTGGRVSAFVITLLFSDVLELLITSFFKLFQEQLFSYSIL